MIHFDFEVELLQDLTSSRRLLKRRWTISPLPGSSASGSRFPVAAAAIPAVAAVIPGRRRPGTGRGGGGTILYDAVLLGSDEVMRKQIGRKALILLTDGVDTGSKVSLLDRSGSRRSARTPWCTRSFSKIRDAYGGNMGGFGGMGRRGGRGRRPDVDAA